SPFSCIAQAVRAVGHRRAVRDGRGAGSPAAVPRRRRDDRDGEERERITYAEAPAPVQAGTPPILAAIGLGAAIEWLSEFDKAAVTAHERALYDHALARTDGLNWLRVRGDSVFPSEVIVRS
ncbi:MAG: aminotransferase class V-fold PLP-dependent enzyme, partial [Rhodoferax sp.]|nr:aminotransferase class V-fold PLP-dependent enzyme [Rhodoferax sp.]